MSSQRIERCYTDNIYLIEVEPPDEDDELIEMFNNIPPVAQNLMYKGSEFQMKEKKWNKDLKKEIYALYV